MFQAPITNAEKLRVVNHVMRRYIFSLCGENLETPYERTSEYLNLTAENRLLIRDLVREYQEREREICEVILQEMDSGRCG